MATTGERSSGVAFVLGGGGLLGANEVGMLRALLEAGIVPDVVLGTSVGAINGAALAAEPTVQAVRRLERLWLSLGDRQVFGGSPLARIRTVVRTRTHAHPNDALRDLLTAELSARTFAELEVPFQCVAASVERATEHWFTEGQLIPAVMASSAVPGLLPPVEVEGEHFLDGGLVNSIPVGRAVELGAQQIFVLQVGRIEQPLTVPTQPWEVAMVAFEIARRNRFVRDLAAVPSDVTVHVLPTGEEERKHYADLANLRYRDSMAIPRRMERAHAATAAYLSRMAG